MVKYFKLLIHFEKSLFLVFEKGEVVSFGGKRARKMSLVQLNTNRMMHPASSGYIYYTGNTDTVQTCLKSLWNSLKSCSLSKIHTFFPPSKSDAGTGFVLHCPLWRIVPTTLPLSGQHLKSYRVSMLTCWIRLNTVIMWKSKVTWRTTLCVWKNNTPNV